MEVVTPDVRTLWMPVDATDKYYIGQLVSGDGGDGLAVVGVAGAGPDTTSSLIGVIVGLNDVTQTFEDGSDVTGFNGQEMAGVVTQADQVARNYFGQEGMYSKGDPQPLAEIAVITPETLVKVPIFTTNFGTAITLQTVTTGSADGLTWTSNTGDFTSIADVDTAYMRTGANAGLYRITDDTTNASTGAGAVDRAFPQDIAVGDTLVRAPLRQGKAQLQLDAEGIFCNAAADHSSYFTVNVELLDLREAGKEHAILRFSPIHFD